jgi:hypothetical protein
MQQTFIYKAIIKRQTELRIQLKIPWCHFRAIINCYWLDRTKKSTDRVKEKKKKKGQAMNYWFLTHLEEWIWHAPAYNSIFPSQEPIHVRYHPGPICKVSCKKREFFSKKKKITLTCKKNTVAVWSLRAFWTIVVKLEAITSELVKVVCIMWFKIF